MASDSAVVAGAVEPPAPTAAPTTTPAPVPVQLTTTPGALAPVTPLPPLATSAAGPTPQGDVLAAGGPTQPFDQKHARLNGTISKFVPSDGWGFVKSQLFEGEVFFRMERVMPEFQSHPLQEGEAVEFDVQADDNNRPHAVSIKPVLGREPQECLGQRHRGYIRRFADRWGFLNSAAFDGDLFVHRDNLLPVPDQLPNGQPPLRTGQVVEFDVALDDRGRTVAKQVTTSAVLRPCDWIGNRLRGHVRSFQGAWGFINSDRFAGDLFIHSDSLLQQHQGAQLTVGTAVEFDVERDHHRKGSKNRLVARRVAVLTSSELMQQQPPPYATMPPPPAQAYPGAYAQPGMHPDPVYSTMPPTQQVPQVYYYQGSQPAVTQLLPDAQLGSVDYSSQPYQSSPAPYPYPPAPYMPMQPPQQQLPPPMPGYPSSQYGAQPPQPLPQYPSQQYPPQALPQQSFPAPAPQGQQPYGAAGQLMPMPQLQPGSFMQPGVVPQAGSVEGQPIQNQALMQPHDQSLGQPPLPSAGEAQPQPSGDGQTQKVLHITVHDWEPDQAGQLLISKGTLVNVSHSAAHGWVYASTVQLNPNSNEPTTEGWIPQAVVRQINLFRVTADWPAEDSGTLGVQKGEIIAVSKEAERGWVYGERIGPSQPDRPSAGWLPKKIIEYMS